MSAETKRESHLREARRHGWYAAALLAAAVLQAVAHHWWVFAGALLLGLLFAVAGAGAFGLAHDAEPWEPADPPKRPGRVGLFLDVSTACVAASGLLMALWAGQFLNATSWALYCAVVVHTARRTVHLRRVTAPAKVSARPGPAEEWL